MHIHRSTWHTHTQAHKHAHKHTHTRTHILTGTNTHTQGRTYPQFQPGSWYWDSGSFFFFKVDSIPSVWKLLENNTLSVLRTLRNGKDVLEILGQGCRKHLTSNPLSFVSLAV